MYYKYCNYSNYNINKGPQINIEDSWEYSQHWGAKDNLEISKHVFKSSPLDVMVSSILLTSGFSFSSHPPLAMLGLEIGSMAAFTYDSETDSFWVRA